jgi:hypothetical protein
MGIDEIAFGDMKSHRFFYGVVTAVGICSIGYPSHSIFLPNWFVKKRGLAIGIAMAGASEAPQEPG